MSGVPKVLPLGRRAELFRTALGPITQKNQAQKAGKVAKMTEEKVFPTPSGDIHYWTSLAGEDRPWLVFLPGLTADHRLFDKQMEGLSGRYSCLVWDAPGHGNSRPFRLDFSMDDLARFLRDILNREGIEGPVLAGQSLGGYIAQVFLELFPGRARGFVSIDSCPLKREYYTGWELAMLKHTYWMYRLFPWGLLKKIGAQGTAMSPYGRDVMRAMMESFTPKEYCLLTDYGFRLLAQAVEAGRKYEPGCPVLLLCGEKDGAGSAKRYNRAWEKRENRRLVWLKGAGHNSNTDAPEEVNRLIDEFAERCSM